MRVQPLEEEGAGARLGREWLLVELLFVEEDMVGLGLSSPLG